MPKTFEQGRDEIAQLCEYFKTNVEAFLAPGVKEAHVRQNLIDPFFEALGWDVRNKTMVAPQYREVVTEDSLDVEDSRKSPDYTFRVGTTPKFYVEAKKCGLSLDKDPAPAFQLRRYGWSAKLPLSLLTDFEELAVYDCTLRPRLTDKASRARLSYFTYSEYPDRWKEIWDIFSREAVWSGAFDHYCASKRSKRGTSEVDEEFLKEIEGWRIELAKHVALRNTDLSSDDLNKAVQLIIDRTVFLRMAEDRGLEPYEQLLHLCGKTDIYKHFAQDICRKADEKYNSGLFHFQKESGVTEEPDRITLQLSVDDKVFKPILQSLYFEHGSPYQFNVIPVEILGTVYERFLGKVIRLTEGHRAKVEEKQEVRKAGGVFYTPAYIVDYIVKHTVGKQIEGKSPSLLAGNGKNGRVFRVLDMACGSGSFLLGAYRFLLEYCLKWYTDNGPEKHEKQLRKDRRTGEWRLSIQEKKRILITHIFGVDIDAQAVEVSKLSLLLKVLEGENNETVGETMQLWNERALPNLVNNVKCGNSLIGPDYFTDSLIPDPDEIKRVNPFDWNHEFSQAMKEGGFDCVIGNPPYLAGREWPDYLWRQRPYFSKWFSCMTDQYDLYALFIQKAVERLSENGRIGYISPTTWLNNEHYISLRRWVSERTEIRVLGDYRDVRVFSQATVLPVVIVATRVQQPSKNAPCMIDRFSEPDVCVSFESSVAVWDHFPDLVFNLSISGRDLSVLKHIERDTEPLKSIADVRFGVKVYQKGKGSPPQTGQEAEQRLFEAHRAKSKKHLPYLYGKDVTPWYIRAGESFLKYGPHLAEPRTIDLFTGPRILVRRILGHRLVLCPTADLFIADQLLHTVKPRSELYDYRFLSGILSSGTIAYYLRKRFNRTEKTFPEVRVAELKSLPIPIVNFSNKADRSRYERMIHLVDSMLALHEHIAAAKSESQRSVIQRQIDATDRGIDQLVYELYGLTEEEIKIVEESDRGIP